jgi:hypothetical protein
MLACCFSAAGLSAQVLNGRIVNTKGEPVPNAAVYVRELAQGVMADDGGAVRLTLGEGRYTLDVSSLGYAKKTVAVAVDGQGATLTVVLDERAYSLEEVTVSAGREDPAYAVMRRAIGMAPYYLYQVGSYESEAYLKGTVQIEKLPALLKLSVNRRQMDDLTGKLHVVESQNEIRFTAPDSYEQRVLALSSSLPPEADISSALSITTSSIYSPRFYGSALISPLAPDAFSYYRFALEGRTLDGGRWINRIRITPRKRNFELMSGWIHIVDDDWNVQHLDATAAQAGITFRIRIHYNEVQPSALLPTAFDADVTFNLMGVKAHMKYSSSIRYTALTLSHAIPPRPIPAAPPASAPPPPAARERTPAQLKAQARLDELAAKDELTNRDAYRMATLMRAVAEPADARRRRDTLEILPAGNVRTTVDTLARRRDTLYWASARPVPLLDDELRSLRTADSLRATTGAAPAPAATNEIAASLPGSSTAARRILSGGRVKMSEQYSLSYSGLLGLMPEYSFTDGFAAGQKLVLEATPAEGIALTLAPTLRYMTARRAAAWQLDAALHCAPLRAGELTLSAGDVTADFNARHGNSRLINTLASLLFARNPIRFYRRQYAATTAATDLANGLRLTAGLAAERRTPLANRTSWNLSGRTPQPNTLPAPHPAMPPHTAATAFAQLQYTPRHYYRLRNGRKHYEYSPCPTFTLRYEIARPAGHAPAASYDRLEAGAQQTLRPGAFDRLTWSLEAGAFLTSRALYFPDYKHFNTAGLRLAAAPPERSFSLLDNYAPSTPQRWMQAHISYTSMYLLLKNLPFLQRSLFDEAAHLRLLLTPATTHAEAGYSIGFGDIGRAGLFAGFDRRRYTGAGITLSIPMF